MILYSDRLKAIVRRVALAPEDLFDLVQLEKEIDAAQLHTALAQRQAHHYADLEGADADEFEKISEQLSRCSELVELALGKWEEVTFRKGKGRA